MKKVFTITLLAFLFFACQSDSKDTADSNENAAVPAVQSNDPHAGHDHATPKHHKASSASPYIGKWTYYHAIKDSDYYKGRYIDLKGDGTFTSGVNDKQTNTGTWTLDEEKNYLDFDYADNTVDRDEQWKSQKNTPDVIILIGNAPKNDSGNQIKLDRVVQ